MDTKVVSLIDEAIVHHEDNLDKLRTLKGEFGKEGRTFIIGEENIYFGATYCALCKEFVGFNESCLECPLKINGYKCNVSNSPWHKIAESTTRSEAIEAEENMIEVLKKVLEKYKPKPKSKFQVGEKVKLIAAGWGYGPELVGKTAIITEVEVGGGSDGYCYEIDIKDAGSRIWTQSLEKIEEFKVGDRVKYVKALKNCYVALSVGDMTTITRINVMGWDGKVPCVDVEKADQTVPVDCLVKVEGAMSKYKEMEKRIAAVEVWDEKMDDIIEELERRPDGTRRGVAILVNDYDGFIGIDRFRTPTTWLTGLDGSNHEGSYVKFRYINRDQKPAALRALLTWLLEHSDIKKSIVGTERDVEIEGKKYKAKILSER